MKSVCHKNDRDTKAKSKPDPTKEKLRERNLTYASKLETLYCGFQLAAVFIGLLLMRPHNISVVAMDTLLLLLMEKLVLRLPNVGVTTVTMLYLWMGQASFFYQVS